MILSMHGYGFQITQACFYLGLPPSLTAQPFIIMLPIIMLPMTIRDTYIPRFVLILQNNRLTKLMVKRLNLKNDASYCSLTQIVVSRKVKFWTNFDAELKEGFHNTRIYEGLRSKIVIPYCSLNSISFENFDLELEMVISCIGRKS